MSVLLLRNGENPLATPWVALSPSPEDEKAQAEHVQCWAGRRSEWSLPFELSLTGQRDDREQDFCDLHPNDSFLFLRQLKGVRRFGYPPPLPPDGISPAGDFLCHDQVNKNTFAFRIEGECVALLNPEETAIMLEELVECTRAYDVMPDNRKIKVPRTE